LAARNAVLCGSAVALLRDHSDRDARSEPDLGQYNRPAGAAVGAAGRPVCAGPCVPGVEDPSKIPPWSGRDPVVVDLACTTTPPQFLPFLSHENPQVLPSPQDTLHPKPSLLVYTIFVPHVVFT
jgi:hypothetical protein